MDDQHIWSDDWINLAQDMDQWRAPVSTVMIILVK
jgi:hypothetical protein